MPRALSAAPMLAEVKALLASLPVFPPDQAPRNDAGFYAPGHYVEISIERRSLYGEGLRQGASSRVPWSLTTVSAANSYTACSNLQAAVADALLYQRLTVDDIPTTSIQLDVGDTPDRLTTGVWVAADVWTFTH